MNYSFESYTLPADYFKPKMVASELRIGNWIESYTVFWDGINVDKTGRPETKDIGIHYFKVDIKTLSMIEKDPLLVTMRPIPITPKILEKCGFIKTDDYWEYEGLKLWFGFSDDGSYYHINSELLINVNHLHQLQNLYFVLTGEELIYKP